MCSCAQRTFKHSPILFWCFCPFLYSSLEHLPRAAALNLHDPEEKDEAHGQSPDWTVSALQYRAGVDVLVRGMVSDTHGVGGLCLPWGFHSVQTSTPGMSHNQSHALVQLTCGSIVCRRAVKTPLRFSFCSRSCLLLSQLSPHRRKGQMAHSMSTKRRVPVTNKSNLEWKSW